MISVFDITKLRSLLKDFYEITQIRITVFDENLNELTSYPDDVADFCKIVRSCETGRIACAECDRNACAKAASQRKTQIYRCHAGLTEAVTPLIVNELANGASFYYESYGKVVDMLNATYYDIVRAEYDSAFDDEYSTADEDE